MEEKILLPTELILQNWREGHTQSERLCAEILHIEGYKKVDPQSPLGGPDNLKDIICEYEGKKWIAACYFPQTIRNFNEIKNKFENDLNGIQRNNAHGLVFFVNQKLTPGNRTQLASIAEPNPVEIYHLERLTALLDSPKGYGVRLQFLHVPMTPEEQIGFFSSLKDDINERFIVQDRQITTIQDKLDEIKMITSNTLGYVTSGKSSLFDKNELEDATRSVYFPTSNLNVGLLFWLHRIISDGSNLPMALRGHFRTVSAWIGKPGCKADEAPFIAPPPDKIFALTEALLSEWVSKYNSIVHSTYDDKICELASFHHKMLSIHPFLDGNGRIARIILQQQALELLNRGLSKDFSEDPETYYNALSCAHNGDLEPLRDLIKACLE